MQKTTDIRTEIVSKTGSYKVGVCDEETVVAANILALRDAVKMDLCWLFEKYVEMVGERDDLTERVDALEEQVKRLAQADATQSGILSYLARAAAVSIEDEEGCCKPLGMGVWGFTKET